MEITRGTSWACFCTCSLYMLIVIFAYSTKIASTGLTLGPEQCLLVLTIFLWITFPLPYYHFKRAFDHEDVTRQENFAFYFLAASGSFYLIGIPVQVNLQYQGVSAQFNIFYAILYIIVAVFGIVFPSIVSYQIYKAKRAENGPVRYEEVTDDAGESSIALLTATATHGQQATLVIDNDDESTIWEETDMLGNNETFHADFSQLKNSDSV